MAKENKKSKPSNAGHSGHANQAGPTNKNVQLVPILWIAAGILSLALLFARAIYPELLALTIIVGVPLLAVLGALINQNQKALRSRTAAYGLNSAVTVILVIGIVGVLNFLVSRYPLKLDLTKNQVHTLSDQTVKVVKSLQTPIKAVFFSKLQQKEQYRPLFDNYKALNPKWEIEYADPDRDPTRAKLLGIKKYGTLHLAMGTRDSKIEDISEEKITNALIKLVQEKVPTLCSMIGHGEKSIESQESEGYALIKKALNEQSYDVKEVNLTQDPKGLEHCDAITILGPTKSFFEAEIKTIRSYLDHGGRAVIAVDVNLKGGGEYAPELLALLHEWHVKPLSAMVVDPLSRMLGVDSSVAILATFSKDSAVTKDFQGNCAFPFTRPLEVIPDAPASLNVHWIAETTPKSWGILDLKQVASGEVRLNESRDKAGPLIAAVSVEGKQKDSQSSRNTRLVVFGSSYFATNNFSRYAGNSDFFLNSVSWVLEDESLISIRAKEDGPGKVELSQKAGTFIFLVTIVVTPLLIALSGLGIWIVRRRL